MEQYPVPQFIESETRVATFLTFKQFFYLVAAGAVCFVLYYILPRFLFYICAIAIGGVAFALGFLKVNGQPFVTIAVNSLKFFIGTRGYNWKKKENLYPFKFSPKTKIETGEGPALKQPRESKLKKLRTRVELRIK